MWYRDLANGCYIAELLARYFPGEVPLHSFENVTSVQLKDSNWYLLRRILQARPRCCSRTSTDAVANTQYQMHSISARRDALALSRPWHASHSFLLVIVRQLPRTHGMHVLIVHVGNILQHTRNYLHETRAFTTAT